MTATPTLNLRLSEGQARVSSLNTSAFPWLFFFLTWLILFPYQNNLNSDWQDSVQLSDVVGTARTGNVLHQCLAVLLGVLGIASLRKYGRGLRLGGTIGRLLIAYVCWIGLSILWTDDPGVTLRRQIAFGLTLLFCAGCAARMKEHCLLMFVAGLAALTAVAGLVQELSHGTLPGFGADNRFAGTVAPNTQGASLSLAAIVAFWFAWRFSGRVRRWNLCAGTILLLFVLMTGSRTSLLGLGVALATSIVLVQLSKYQNAPGGIAGVLLLILLGLASAAALTELSGITPTEVSGTANALRTDRDVGEVTDLTGRNLIWQTCLRYAAERPALGFGYGGFWTASRLAAISDDLKWTVPHAHSAYLDVLLQLGIPGIALYTLLISCCIVVCVRRFIRIEGPYGAWVSIFVFIATNGLTESIVVLDTFPEVVTSLLIMKLALGRRELVSPPLGKSKDGLSSGQCSLSV